MAANPSRGKAMRELSGVAAKIAVSLPNEGGRCSKVLKARYVPPALSATPRDQNGERKKAEKKRMDF
jgi:hypothetical protein